MTAQNVYESEEERQRLIAAYVKTIGTRKTGKTDRHRKNGYFIRKVQRRVAHEGWMSEVRRSTHGTVPHPFHKAA